MSILNYAVIGDTVANVATSRLEIRAYSDKERKHRIMGKGFVAPINPSSIKIAYSNSLAGKVGLNSTGPKLSLSNNNAEKLTFKLVLTDSSVFHYTGRNLFTLFNNYESDSILNFSYAMGLPLSTLNGTESGITTELTYPGSYIKPLNSGMAGDLLPVLARDGHVAFAIERFLNLTTQKPLSPNGVEKNGEANKEGIYSNSVYLGLVWGRVFTRPGGKDAHGDFKAKRQKVYPCYLDSVDVNYTHFTRDGRVLRAELDCTFTEDSSGDA